MSHIAEDISACRICAARFAATKTQHRPRPVAWFAKGTPILIAGQAPGMRVQQSGKPFDDRSGDRLRDWLGLDRDAFYDTDFVSFVPTAFCFPGYDAKGADLPPPPVCWDTWHADVLDHIGPPQLRIIIGQYAIKRHLGRSGSLGAVIADWRSFPDGTFVLPHPSWRNSGWLKKNPVFETEILPVLREQVGLLLAMRDLT
ncbi:MAG: uracil-DNA glycosylase family protein [Yoonia sp.]|uniref:uracil-DNA glycosylase family protein n=1 Tax=Yoonia sp. TaxID=2212373 RepID=UPI0032665860